MNFAYLFTYRIEQMKHRISLLYILIFCFIINMVVKNEKSNINRWK